MADLLASNKEYLEWLKALKSKIRSAQIKAALKVNEELLNFYWELGADIIKKQALSKWGEGFLAKLSQDLTVEFPEMKGFSISNIKYIRQWVLFYSKEKQISQQAVGQITKIPWGHNIAIISKCKNIREAQYYAQKTLTNNWSRNVLTHQIESELYHREGKSIANFTKTLPSPQSDLAQQILKDPYSFDFLTIREKHDERELEDALIQHVTKFLLELGAGFAYVGRQLPLQVGEPFKAPFTMNCTLSKKPIENYAPAFNHLPIDDCHAADICSWCIDKFTKWQWSISANLFPTKTAKKMFKKNVQ